MFGLFLQVFCSTDHIYAYFKLEMDQELPYTYGKVGWGHLAPLQVPFQVRGRPKMPIFWVKIDHDGRLPYQLNNPPGNMKMHQNTPQVMGIHVLDTFTPHPGAIPGPGRSKNGWF